jgi:N-acetylmuramoyl-L-alanine amidase
LKTLLEKEGLEVILTRGSDIFLPVEDRTVIANQKQADLFISIHANATRNRKLSGIETFYLNFNQDPSVIATAARENATSTKNIRKMKHIIEKIIQNTKIPESKELAKGIQDNLVKSLSKKYSNINSLGVKGGPFWVLIGAEVPSVLVEISFLSNPTEEKRLQNTQYRQRIAQGIYEGIMAYKHSLEKGTIQ